MRSSRSPWALALSPRVPPCASVWTPTAPIGLNWSANSTLPCCLENMAALLLIIWCLALRLHAARLGYLCNGQLRHQERRRGPLPNQGADGYTPSATYLGSLGYCLELALRPGVQHSAR